MFFFAGIADSLHFLLTGTCVTNDVNESRNDVTDADCDADDVSDDVSVSQQQHPVEQIQLVTRTPQETLEIVTFIG